LGTFFRRTYILPPEHGSWIWWIGPLLIGLAAAGHVPPDTCALFAAGLLAFLLRQPASILVKARVGRRPADDTKPAALWLTADAILLLGVCSILVALGHARLFLLALPAGCVFLWHLYLVSRRAERGQAGIEIVGAGTLALAAPAGYLFAGGSDLRMAGILWMLCWLQSAASILLVYFRLALRRLPASPPLAERVHSARRVLLYHAFNTTLALILLAAAWIPAAMVAGFVLMLIDAVESVLNPPIRSSPRRIGTRQLAASAAFVALAVAGLAVSSTP
jgi:hypothetical protein